MLYFTIHTLMALAWLCTDSIWRPKDKKPWESIDDDQLMCVRSWLVAGCFCCCCIMQVNTEGLIDGLQSRKWFSVNISWVHVIDKGCTSEMYRWLSQEGMFIYTSLIAHRSSLIVSVITFHVTFREVIPKLFFAVLRIFVVISDCDGLWWCEGVL